MIKQLIIILFLCFGLTGCSLLKVATAPFKNTVSNVPQSIDKSRAKAMCQGEAKFNEQGDMIYCSSGYFKYDESSSIQERRLTLKEKILQFFSKLAGISFWLVIALIFLCPSLLGLIAGRLFEGVYGIGAKAFKQVSTAIQKVKDSTPTLVDALEKSTDESVKDFIADFKKKNGIK
jgi:hypothetical protein